MFTFPPRRASNVLKSHERYVYLYKPKALSWVTNFVGYLTNKLPQFLNPEKVISQGEGREGNLIWNFLQNESQI